MHGYFGAEAVTPGGGPTSSRRERYVYAGGAYQPISLDHHVPWGGLRRIRRGDLRLLVRRCRSNRSLVRMGAIEWARKMLDYYSWHNRKKIANG